MKKFFTLLATTLALATASQAGTISWDIWLAGIPFSDTKYVANSTYTVYAVLNEGNNKLDAANALLLGMDITTVNGYLGTLSVKANPSTGNVVLNDANVKLTNSALTTGSFYDITLFVMLPILTGSELQWGDIPEWALACDSYSNDLATYKFIFFDVNHMGVGSSEKRDLRNDVLDGMAMGWFQDGTSDIHFEAPNYNIVGIPEPATGLLALAGGAMLLMRRRRK